MTAPEFAAWMKGINTVLNGQPPSADLWKRITEEAAKLGTLPFQYAPNALDRSVRALKEEFIRERKDELIRPIQPRWINDHFIERSSDAPMRPNTFITC